MIRALWAAAWSAARLDGEGLQRWKATPGNLAWSLALLALVSFLGALGDAAASASPQPTGPAAWERQEALLASIQSTLARSPLPIDAQHELARNLAAWLDLRRELDGLPRPLGRQASQVWHGLAHAFTAPYRRLALWLPYSLMVLSAARALGGRALLTEMLGTTALYAVPHLLDMLHGVPVLGPLLGLIALVWGAAVYVKATAAANELDTPRAVLAVVLPGLVAITLALVLLSLLVVGGRVAAWW